MRKYFLLSAVALLATTSANATTDYAEVTAKATIVEGGTFECCDLDFGNIVVKQNFNDSTVTLNPDTKEISFEGDIAAVTYNSTLNKKVAMCPAVSSGVIPENIIFTGKNEDTLPLTLTMANIDVEPTLTIGGTLTIPAGSKADDYVGKFTVTITY